MNCFGLSSIFDDGCLSRWFVSPSLSCLLWGKTPSLNIRLSLDPISDPFDEGCIFLSAWANCNGGNGWQARSHRCASPKTAWKRPWEDEYSPFCWSPSYYYIKLKQNTYSQKQENNHRNLRLTASVCSFFVLRRSSAWYFSLLVKRKLKLISSRRPHSILVPMLVKTK